MTEKKKTTKRKRDTSICLGCIKEFNNSELFRVSIDDKIGMKFTSVFCEKCIKDKNFPQNEQIEVLGPAKKKRKTKRTKNE